MRRQDKQHVQKTAEHKDEAIWVLNDLRGRNPPAVQEMQEMGV